MEAYAWPPWYRTALTAPVVPFAALTLNHGLSSSRIPNTIVSPVRPSEPATPDALTMSRNTETIGDYQMTTRHLTAALVMAAMVTMMPTAADAQSGDAPAPMRTADQPKVRAFREWLLRRARETGLSGG